MGWEIMIKFFSKNFTILWGFCTTSMVVKIYGGNEPLRLLSKIYGIMHHFYGGGLRRIRAFGRTLGIRCFNLVFEFRFKIFIRFGLGSGPECGAALTRSIYK